MRRRSPLAVLALAAAVIGGCGGGGKPAPVAGAGAGGDASVRLTAMRDVDVSTPLVRGAPVGLEAHWWVVNDADLVVARALAAWEIAADATAASLADQIAAWRSNGLRAARVPIDRYDLLREAMPPSRTYQRVWLGESSAWRELVRGRTAGGSRRLLVDGRITQLPAGKLRLLARAWAYPTAEGPRLRVELVPHIDEADPGRIRQLYDQLESPASISQTADGLVLASLELGLTLAPGELLVVTADAPSADWSRTPPPRAAQLAALGADPEAQPAAPEPTDGAIPWDPAASRPEQGAGPPSSRALTVGEAMLSASPEEAGDGGAVGVAGLPKVVIVLIPRLADRFSLFGDAAAAGNGADPEPNPNRGAAAP